MTKPKLEQCRVWLNSELLDWTRRDAAYNKRSLSGEITFCVERYREEVEIKKALGPIAKQTPNASNDQ